MHCHMTHHVMNQMGHGIPNMIGVDAGGFEDEVGSLIPTYMTMGQNGIDAMGKHIESGHMKAPANSLPMVGAQGPHDYITMGGMFTILKVRDDISNFRDPGWYQDPKGMARPATSAQLSRDGISVPKMPGASHSKSE